MADERSKKTTFQIFIIVLGVAFVVFIGIWLYDIYSSNRQISTELSKSVIECTGYAFEVDRTTLVYSEGKLSFLITNPYGSKFDVLLVKSDSGVEKEALLRNFMQGNSEVVSFEGMNVTKSFEVYPKGCPNNAKTYKI